MREPFWPLAIIHNVWCAAMYMNPRWDTVLMATVFAGLTIHAAWRSR